MASPSSNNFSTAFPGAGTAYALNAGAEMQSGSVDTTVMKPNLAQFVAVTLTAAQVQAMYATPVQLIAAPAAGTSIVVDQCLVRVLSTGQTAFAGGGAVDIQYNNTIHGAGTTMFTTLPAATVNSATNVDTQLGNTAANVTIPQATGVFISNATGAFTTGTGSLIVYLWYQIT